MSLAVEILVSAEPLFTFCLATSNSRPQKAMEASYDAQLRIRRDAEERSVAHQDLASWMESLQASKPATAATEKRKNRAATTKSNASTFTSTPPSIPSKEGSSCDEERLRGNQCFAQGKYEDAIQCYTRCLSNKDALASPLVYSNRGKCVASRYH